MTAKSVKTPLWLCCALSISIQMSTMG